MKLTFCSVLFAAVALAFQASAETSTKISGVHLCCQACVKGVEKALTDVKGVTVAVDKDAETVTLTGADKASVQKAANALVAGGYFGKSSDSSIKVPADSGAKGVKVQSVKLEGVHLCCGQCVSVVNDALKTVPGVKANTAKKNVGSFEVTGDFNDKEVIDALQKEGLAARVAR